MFCHCFLPKKQPWYDTKNKNHKQVSEKTFYKTSQINYFTTLSHYDFSKITIPLFMITSEFDLCLG